jgi:hypothetical protein
MKTLTILGQELKIKMSHSFINNAACPFYLKCNYVDKLGDKFIRVAAERGKACHEAIHELLQGCIDREITTRDLPATLISAAVQKHTPHHILHEIPDILEWITQWAERFRMPAHINGLEEKVGLDDLFDECDFHEASYRGVIDMLQIKGDHALVTDWKSQAHIMSQGELDAHEQMTFYCWLIWKLYPDEVTRFTARIWYLRYGFWMDTVRTEDDLIAFEQALMIKERKISEITSWDPIPGKHCGYCDYILSCPIALDLSPENQAIITQDQAIIAAQKLTVMDALKKELTAGVKQYVDTADNVMIGDDWVYGKNHTVSDKWDVKKLAPVLKKHNRDLADFCNADTKKVKKLLKEAAKDDPALQADLENIREEKHQTKFQGYQRK